MTLTDSDIAKMTQQFRALRPAGGFKVVSADPPWDFANYSERGEEKNAKKHYECMSAAAIAAMPVEILAADNCALFLWCTWPLMPSWMRVVEGWGFQYAGLAWEWVKFNPETGKYAFGPGYGTRKNLEPCLLATRGQPQLGTALEFFGVTDDRAGTRAVRDFIQTMPVECVRAPRREHSRKPDEHFTRIETMFDGPYIELFARERRKGWASWGNEIDRFAKDSA